jgi:penicillin-binding protein-related factor A (putative recombinase)
MLEAQFNTIIGNSLDWRHKIGDAGRFKKPFDGFGVFRGKPVYWEAKWLKTPKAFPWSRLEDHQIESLLNIQRLMPDAHCLFIIGVDYGRADKRIFIFTDMELVNRRKQIEKSILKKEFDARTDYVKITQQLIPFGEVLL